MKNCIITPTFSGHFKYITDYLKSFQLNASPRDNFEICFTISRGESACFQKIISKFPDLNIRVLFFEDILAHFNIKYTPDELLKKYEKFSFQTLKKFYTMLYLGADYRFLVLDSESVLLNKCNINELFNKFFNAPFISVSGLEKRIISPFVVDVKTNTGFILQSDKIQNLWFLENFVWFYDYKILTDMFQKHGLPFDMVDAVYKNAYGKHNIAVFEIDLYHSFIYLHHKKYKYNVINADEMLNKIPDANNYKFALFKKFNGGCGLLEHATLFLTHDNVKPLASVFKENGFSIIRCEYTIPSNYKLQKMFLDIVQPDILAAAQDHCFGVKHTLKQRLLTAVRNTNFSKIKSHIKLFLQPIGHIFQWLYQPVYLIFSIVIFVIKFIKNIILLYKK